MIPAANVQHCADGIPGALRTKIVMTIIRKSIQENDPDGRNRAIGSINPLHYHSKSPPKLGGDVLQHGVFT